MLPLTGLSPICPPPPPPSHCPGVSPCPASPGSLLLPVSWPPHSAPHPTPALYCIALRGPFQHPTFVIPQLWKVPANNQGTPSDPLTNLLQTSRSLVTSQDRPSSFGLPGLSTQPSGPCLALTGPHLLSPTSLETYLRALLPVPSTPRPICAPSSSAAECLPHPSPPLQGLDALHCGWSPGNTPWLRGPRPGLKFWLCHMACGLGSVTISVSVTLSTNEAGTMAAISWDCRKEIPFSCLQRPLSLLVGHSPTPLSLVCSSGATLQDGSEWGLWSLAAGFEHGSTLPTSVTSSRSHHLCAFFRLKMGMRAPTSRDCGEDT